MSDQAEALQARIREAAARGTPLRIHGGNSKAFYGRAIQGEALDTSAHRGIVNYEPTELVLTARAGTPLHEIETALGEHGQMLAFEPPHFAEQATLGGCVASGLSGPARPYRGAVRDFVLGVSLINGKGERLHFGGEVMKNVAGYDIARLSCGALGTLGVLLDISIKVLPRPAHEQSYRREASAREALQLMNVWAGQPWPLSACAYTQGEIVYRLSGGEGAVKAAARELGGEALTDTAWWDKLKEQQLDFFATAKPLWRMSLPYDAAALDMADEAFIDWGGAQRWIASEAQPAFMYDVAARAGGHAQLFRGGDRRGQVFASLAPSLLTLHQRLKASFDPQGILNPGIMYAEL